MKDLILTVRVPFCMSRCSFCSKDDIRVCPRETRDAYTAALMRELLSVRDELAEYRLRTIFFTGGTPTLLAGQQLPDLVREILKASNPADDRELTIATNPGCLGINVLSRLKDYGLSRVEFSLGSVDPLEQDILGRRYGEDEMYVSRQILEFGQADTFSVDILRGQPGQRRANMRSLAESALRFAPPAAAVYPLRYSEKTPLHTLLTQGGKTIPNIFYRSLPDARTQLDCFTLAEELFGGAGLRPYTVYHYAKPGFESLHHRLVRTDIDRMELGVGGVTVSGGTLIRNTGDLDAYIRHAGDPSRTLAEVRPLTDHERMRGHIIGRLGLLQGFDPAECLSLFGCAPEPSALDLLAEKELLSEEAGAWRLTKAGACFFDTVSAAL